MRRVAGVVLAAGAGMRMGVAKAELVIDGIRLLDRAVAVLRTGGCDPVIAVVRPGTAAGGALVVENPDPDRGMRSSLELALAAAAGTDAVAVVLVDLPGVTATGVSAVVRAWRPGRIAVGSYAGRPGHPTVMSPGLWAEALALAGADEGARALLRARPELIDEVAIDGSAADLDTPEDVRLWVRRAQGD